MDSAIPRTSEEFTPRQRDRRMAFVELLAALSRALNDGSKGPAIRSVFEESLRRMFPVRSIQLREGPNRWAARSEGSVGSESIAFDIPGTDAESAGVLEASFDPECRLGEWDFQMLGAAAHLAALVLEIDQAKLRWPRPGFALITTRRDGAAPLIGSTPAMQFLRSRIERVAGTDFTVLLEGESGVGKELVARQIHDLSRRRHGPFVAINCAALVETLLEAELFGIEERTATGVRGRRGKFEYADGGTLFLDEVSDLSLSAQAKLLRAIQDLSVERVGGNGTRRIDLRIVAATNRNLLSVVERQLFRPDLYYRLSGVDIRVPALRERRADIVELARYFLERHRTTRRLRLSSAAADALLAYDWPGNVRELERLIERAVALAGTDVLELDDLPPVVCGESAPALMPALERKDTLRAWGGRYARLVLDRCRGNKREACRVLDITYHTLQGYLREPVGEGNDGPVAHWPDAINESVDAGADEPECNTMGV